MGSTPLGGFIGFSLKFSIHIKDSKWGRKCIFMNCASRNGSPQQIPLQRLPFPNDTKPCYCCRVFWAWFHTFIPYDVFISSMHASFNTNCVGKLMNTFPLSRKHHRSNNSTKFTAGNDVWYDFGALHGGELLRNI